MPLQETDLEDFLTKWLGSALPIATDRMFVSLEVCLLKS